MDEAKTRRAGCRSTAANNPPKFCLWGLPRLWCVGPSVLEDNRPTHKTDWSCLCKRQSVVLSLLFYLIDPTRRVAQQRTAALSIHAHRLQPIPAPQIKTPMAQVETVLKQSNRIKRSENSSLQLQRWYPECSAGAGAQKSTQEEQTAAHKHLRLRFSLKKRRAMLGKALQGYKSVELVGS